MNVNGWPRARFAAGIAPEELGAVHSPFRGSIVLTFTNSMILCLFMQSNQVRLDRWKSPKGAFQEYDSAPPDGDPLSHVFNL